MATEYGKRLRSARKEAGLTQVKLSELTGIPQSTISTAEREAQGSSDTSTYALYCGVSPHWLATGEGDRKAAGQVNKEIGQRDFARERKRRINEKRPLRAFVRVRFGATESRHSLVRNL